MLCCLPGCPALLQGPSCCGLLPHIPWGCLPTVNSSPHRGTALQSLPPAPSHSVYQRTCIPVQGVAAAAWIVYADLTPFRPSQISCFPLQQPQMPLPCPKLLLLCGDLTPASVPPPFGSRSSLTLPLFFPSSLHPTNFCVDLYVPFWWLGILPALSWCSVGSSASEDAFLMHPWREKHSTSTYSSTISSSLR